MKTVYIRFFLLVPFMSGLISCGSDDGGNPASGTDIISFNIGETEGTIDQDSKTISLDLLETNLTSLVPTIVISENATIDPPSGVAQDFTNPISYIVTGSDGATQTYNVTVASLITPVTFNGQEYEIVRANMTWTEAAAFAVSRGGFLAEINDSAEQNGAFSALNDASLDTDNTTAPDGGGASYVWIGGNDVEIEGDWIWDGDNDGNGTLFWVGLFNGDPAGDLYNNWSVGNEPDNFGSSQDGLGLALTDWPFGTAGQWNDISSTNRLYFLIELN